MSEANDRFLFDLDNTRQVPLWLPLLCFLLAAAFYLAHFLPALSFFKDIFWLPLPLGFISLSIYLRSRSSGQPQSLPDENALEQIETP